MNLQIHDFEKNLIWTYFENIFFDQKKNDLFIINVQSISNDFHYSQILIQNKIQLQIHIRILTLMSKCNFTFVE